MKKPLSRLSSNLIVPAKEKEVEKVSASIPKKGLPLQRPVTPPQQIGINNPNSYIQYAKNINSNQQIASTKNKDVPNQISSISHNPEQSVKSKPAPLSDGNPYKFNNFNFDLTDVNQLNSIVKNVVNSLQKPATPNQGGVSKPPGAPIYTDNKLNNPHLPNLNKNTNFGNVLQSPVEIKPMYTGNGLKPSGNFVPERDASPSHAPLLPPPVSELSKPGSNTENGEYFCSNHLPDEKTLPNSSPQSSDIISKEPSPPKPQSTELVDINLSKNHVNNLKEENDSRTANVENIEADSETNNETNSTNTSIKYSANNLLAFLIIIFAFVAIFF